MKKFRKIIPAFLAVPLVFVLTACNMEYTLRVVDENNVSDVVTFSMTADEKQQMQMLAMGEELTCETIFSESDIEGSNAQINTISDDDGGMACELIQPHDPSDLDLTKNGDTWTLVVDGGSDFEEIDEARAEMGAFASGLFTLSIEMPANITSVQPETGTVDGNTVTFDLFSDDLTGQMTITASEGAAGGFPWVILVVILIVLVVAGVLLLVVLSKKKNKPDQGQVYGQQGYPPVYPGGPQQGMPGQNPQNPQPSAPGWQQQGAPGQQPQQPQQPQAGMPGQPPVWQQPQQGTPGEYPQTGAQGWQQPQASSPQQAWPAPQQTYAEPPASQQSNGTQPADNSGQANAPAPQTGNGWENPQGCPPQQ